MNLLSVYHTALHKVLGTHVKGPGFLFPGRTVTPMWLMSLSELPEGVPAVNEPLDAYHTERAQWGVKKKITASAS